MRGSGWGIRDRGMGCRIISVGLSSIRAAGLRVRNTAKGNSLIKMGGRSMTGDSKWIPFMAGEAIGMVRAC